MVKVFRIFVVMTLLLVFATPALAKGPNRQVPIKGTVMGEHVRDMFDEDCRPPGADPAEGDVWWRFSSDGVGQMSHLGRVEYSLTQCTVPGPAGIASVGTVTFTAANGDELRIEHTMLSHLVFEPGIEEEPPPIGFEMDGNWWPTRGTGRFANALGDGGMLYGVGDLPEDQEPSLGLPNGFLELNFEGTIAYKRK